MLQGGRSPKDGLVKGEANKRLFGKNFVLCIHAPIEGRV